MGEVSDSFFARFLRYPQHRHPDRSGGVYVVLDHTRSLSFPRKRVRRVIARAANQGEQLIAWSIRPQDRLVDEGLRSLVTRTSLNGAATCLSASVCIRG